MEKQKHRKATDKEMLLIAYGSLKASSSTDEQWLVTEMIGDHLFPVRNKPSKIAATNATQEAQT